jgi:hypothetical protein
MIATLYPWFCVSGIELRLALYILIPVKRTYGYMLQYVRRDITFYDAAIKKVRFDGLWTVKRIQYDL